MFTKQSIIPKAIHKWSIFDIENSIDRVLAMLKFEGTYFNNIENIKLQNHFNICIVYIAVYDPRMECRILQ